MPFCVLTNIWTKRD